MNLQIKRWMPAAGIILLVTGCTVLPPNGPSVVALPPQGKPLQKFQEDDYGCRNYAFGITNNNGTSQAATNSGLNSAAIGTLGGAAAGALLGAAAGNAGVGAAIGAGSGLLLGSAAGANNAQAAGGSLQAQYDAAYAQCMVSKGNVIQQPPQPMYVQPPPVYYAPPPPPVYYYGPPRPGW